MSYPGPQDQIKDPEAYREFQRLAESLAEMSQMKVVYRAPDRPRDGHFCVASGTTWNPLGDGIKRPVWFDEAAGVWKAF